MKKHLVLSNIPIRLPFQSTILYTFLLHYFNADGIYWGVFITIYSILWIVAIIVKATEIKVDINSDKDDPKTINAQSKFAKRMLEFQNKK